MQGLTADRMLLHILGHALSCVALYVIVVFLPGRRPESVWDYFHQGWDFFNSKLGWNLCSHSWVGFWFLTPEWDWGKSGLSLLLPIFDLFLSRESSFMSNGVKVRSISSVSQEMHGVTRAIFDASIWLIEIHIYVHTLPVSHYFMRLLLLGRFGLFHFGD